jgi:hypothetical protein
MLNRLAGHNVGRHYGKQWLRQRHSPATSAIEALMLCTCPANRDQLLSNSFARPVQANIEGRERYPISVRFSQDFREGSPLYSGRANRLIRALPFRNRSRSVTTASAPFWKRCAALCPRLQ